MRPIVARLLRFTLFDYDGDGAGDRWSNYVEATTHGHFERSRKRVDGWGGGSPYEVGALCLC